MAMPDPRRALTAALAILLCGSAAAAGGPQFIEDDFAAARLQAAQRKVPIVVEVWAPW